jgi:hypothetical protein
VTNQAALTRERQLICSRHGISCDARPPNLWVSANGQLLEQRTDEPGRSARIFSAVQILRPPRIACCAFRIAGGVVAAEYHRERPLLACLDSKPRTPSGRQPASRRCRDQSLAKKRSSSVPETLRFGKNLGKDSPLSLAREYHTAFNFSGLAYGHQRASFTPISTVPKDVVKS